MSKSIKKEEIAKVDLNNMRQLIIDFPSQCLEAERIGLKCKIPNRYINKPYKNIIFAGMGGSAIGADLIRSYLKFTTQIPLYVNRSYLLPKFASNDSLVFVCSYSGNTEETLSCFNLARKKRANIICLSSNGKLEKLSEKNNYLFVKIPKTYPPRCALGYSVFPLLMILKKLKLADIKNSEINKTLSLLKRISNELKPSNKSNLATKTASKLFGKFVVIYGSSSTTEIPALRFRGQLAENSKTLSSHHIFPEMNHNEIVGWEYPKKVLKDFVVVILRSSKDHKRVKKRIEISKKIIKKAGVPIIEIEARGLDLLSQIFSLIYTCDWISFYLAIFNGVNPTPVERVEFLKKELAKE
jgi:glucose/mannose-6-phosphate isomerase